MYDDFDQLKALFELDSILSDETRGLQQRADDVVAVIAQACHADRIFLAHFDGAQSRLCMMTQWHGAQLEPMPAGCFELDEQVSLLDYIKQNYSMFALMQAPIIHQGRILGILCLESRDPAHRLDQEERGFVELASKLLHPLIESLSRSLVSCKLSSVASVDTLPFPANGGAVGSPQVLVVEDNKINQMMIVRLLEKCHVEVSVANDGLEAIQACAAKKFDLILMDLSMPRMDGFETTCELLSGSQRLNRETPIVAVTANTSDGIKERCTQIGMAGYLSKPLSSAKVQTLCEDFLEI